MEVYEAHIFMMICEISLDLCKKTKFVSYGSYCRDMNMSILNKQLSGREINDISVIGNTIEKIYSLSKEEVGDYIARYFASGSCETYGNAIRLTNEYFPNCRG